MADVIVVDDEPDLAFMVADHLGTCGHRVRMARDGRELRAAFEVTRADLVVLDINLPGENGLSLAGWLRERHDPGIIMLSAVGDAFDRIAALETGADDYLTKPFDPVELELRIAAILRRRRPGALPDGQLAFGPYVFDLKAFRLLDAAGETVDLRPMELDLVAAFATNAGRLLTRRELLVLAPARDGEPFDRSIDSRIRRLRRRLERDPARPELIKTHRSGGYLYPGREGGLP